MLKWSLLSAILLLGVPRILMAGLVQSDFDALTLPAAQNFQKKTLVLFVVKYCHLIDSQRNL